MSNNKLLLILDKLRFGIVAAVLVVVPIAFGWFMENMQIFDLNKLLFFRPLVLLLSLVLLAGVFVKGQVNWRSSKLWWLWLAALLLFLLNLLVSVDTLTSFLGSYQRQQGIYSLLFYLLFFALAAGSLRGKAEIDRLILWITGASGLVALYASAQMLGLDFMHWQIEASRISSSLGQPNFLAHYLVMVLPLSAYALVFLAKGWRRLPILAVIALQLTSLYGTFSRGGYVGVMMALLIIAAGLVYITKRWQKVFYFSLVAVVMVFLVLIWRYDAIMQSPIYQGLSSRSRLAERVMSIFDLYGGSNNVRYMYWSSILSEFSHTTWQHRLFGYGKDMQETVTARYYRPDWGVFEKLNTYPDRAHNLLLDIWLEFGLVGLLLLTALGGCILLKAWQVACGQDWQQRWLVLALSGAIGGYLGAGFFSFPLTTQYVYYYFLLAALFALSAAPAKVVAVPLGRPARQLLWVVLALFAVFLSYQFDFCQFMADHYLIKAKTGEARGDVRMMLDNIELTRSWFPLSSYYREQYVYVYNNSLDFLNTKKALQDAYSNVAPELADFSRGELGHYYILTDVAHAYSLFGLRLDKGYYVQAAAAYEQLIALSPYITTAYQDYGRMEMWAGENDRAIALFRRGLAVTPDAADERLNGEHQATVNEQRQFFNSLLCDCYYAKKNWTRALGYCLSAEKNIPEVGHNLKTTADLYRKMGDKQKALLYLGRAVNASPGNSVWALEAANLAKELGNRSKALRFAQKAAAFNPRNQAAQKLLAELGVKIK